MHLLFFTSFHHILAVICTWCHLPTNTVAWWSFPQLESSPQHCRFNISLHNIESLHITEKVSDANVTPLYPLLGWQETFLPRLQFHAELLQFLLLFLHLGSLSSSLLNFVCQLVCGLSEPVRETHLHLPEIQIYMIFVVELLPQLRRLQVNLEQNVLLFVEVYLEHLIVLLKNSFWFSASSLAAVSFLSWLLWCMRLSFQAIWNRSSLFRFELWVSWDAMISYFYLYSALNSLSLRSINPSSLLSWYLRLWIM